MKRVETITNPAIAAYFQVLRGAQLGPDGKKKLTQGQLAQRVSNYLRRTVNQWDISRIEQGGIPDGDVMTAALELLGGHIEDVAFLLKKENASELDGQQRAVAALAADIPTEDELERLIADWQTDEQLRRSLRRVWRGAHTSGGAN
jgi:hypothetical protein